MANLGRNRLLTRYAFNILDFEDFPKVCIEIHQLRSQTLELDGLRHAKAKMIRRLQSEKELEQEIEFDFNVTRGVPHVEVKKALLALYKEIRVLHENSLDVDIAQAQKDAAKMASNVCYKIMGPLEDLSTVESDDKILDILKNIIESLEGEKNDLEIRRKTNAAELKKRQQIVRQLEKRVSKTAVAQEAAMTAALDNFKANKELSENDMLLVALHRWKTLNLRLRSALHASYLRYVDVFDRFKNLENEIFQELLIAPPLIYEAQPSEYIEKPGSSQPGTPDESLYDIVCERSRFPFLLAHLSLRTEFVIQKWEKTIFLKAALRETGAIIRERNLSFNPKDDLNSTPSSRKESKKNS